MINRSDLRMLKSNKGCLRPLGLLVLLAGLGASCNGQATFFSSTFINTVSGDVFPRTPGPNAPFILVRVINATDDTVEFVVTVEREVFVEDDDGNLEYEDLNENGQYDQGEPLVTRAERETVRLPTVPFGQASDVGILFDCGDSIITRIGLGDNLLPTDSAAFVGGSGAGGAVGFGILPGQASPLSWQANNYDCGDTVIFRAIQSASVAGNVAMDPPLLLPYIEQPSDFSGANTFATYDAFLESQIREDEP